MNKSGLILLLFLQATAFAEAYSDALVSREQAMQAVKGFNPATALKNYTTNPSEIHLAPQESSNELETQGLNALKNNPIANDVYNQANTRSKVHANPNSPDMRYVESLLENPEKILEGACFKQKGACTSHPVTKICEDHLSYHRLACQKKLNVIVKTSHQQLTRAIEPNPFENWLSFNLSACANKEWLCNARNLANLLPTCEALTVTVSQWIFPLQILKFPTCQDPTLTVGLMGDSFYLPLQINLTERYSEDLNLNDDCQLIQAQAVKEGCVFEGTTDCLNPNGYEWIEGLRIKRTCWGKELSFQCPLLAETNCTPFISEGCSQIGSICVALDQNRCERYEQTFQCQEQRCLPSKTICPGTIACSNGECDKTVIEESNDIKEGLSRLSVLAGSAAEVADLQIESGQARIFKGEAQECEKYPLGTRDCCTDKGFLDDFIHCPPELKILQEAKKEHRVVSLGHYKNHTLGKRRYVYCVFPTKLAALVQIQGRGVQLKIPFGEAKAPDCRGLLPDELERIDFGKLDLSAIEQDIVARMKPPQDSQSQALTIAHVEKLFQAERAYD